MTDWVSVVEAAYRLEGDDDAWLSAVMASAAPLMPNGRDGSYAFTYDATDPGAFRLETVITPAFPPGANREQVELLFAGLAAGDVEQSFGQFACATASQVFGDVYLEKIRFSQFGSYGIKDTFGVNALDPTGRGTGLGSLLTERSLPDAGAVRTWTKVAAHIAAARRLRTALRGPLGSDPSRHERAEAVLTTGGNVEYAANDAVQSARGALVKAVGAIERARGKARATEPDAALDGWTAMVEARWSLVEHFERDGKRYMVAVRNDATPDGETAPARRALTLRELQVLGFALLGHPSKITAYELGISAATVRVLLARALKKLGVSSALELLRRTTPSA